MELISKVHFDYVWGDKKLDPSFFGSVFGKKKQFYYRTNMVLDKTENLLEVPG